MKSVVHPLAWLITLCLMGYTASLGAESLSEDKPFADVHVIMQVSQAEAPRQRLVLDIANNLTKHYGGQDAADLEVIAFGPGVQLLLAADNPNATRIASLMEHGVRFYVCGNTLDTMERNSGVRPAVLNGVVTVQTGVAFMLEEIARGYTHIHP